MYKGIATNKTKTNKSFKVNMTMTLKTQRKKRKTTRQMAKKLNMFFLLQLLLQQAVPG